MSADASPPIAEQPATSESFPEHTVNAALAFHMREGPLPDAASFAAYEKVTPGAGDRILCMAEKEQANRLEK